MADFNYCHLSSVLHSTLKQGQAHSIQNSQNSERLQETLAQLDRGILQDKLAQLNLSSVASSLGGSTQGQGWTDRQAHLAIARYLLFLFLCYLHPAQILVPPKDVDLVWHEHLLQDTRKYARDCEMLFNGFVHHSHQSQLWESSPVEQTQAAYQQTRSLLHQYLQGSEDDLAKALLAQEKPSQNEEGGACGHPV